MRRHVARPALRRYAVAWAYLVGVSAAEIVDTALPSHAQAALLAWASTNVHNLRHDPLGSMIASAFFPAESAIWWPALIALALFGANKVLGNWRTAAVCTAGHVIGTLVSEEILEYQVTHGTLPASARYVLDVGPSYVVVAAIAVAIGYGGWLARPAAVIDLALLAVIGDIFGGLSVLQVSAVGHVTALGVGAIASSAAVWRRRRAASQHGTPSPGTPSPGTLGPGTPGPGTLGPGTADQAAADRAAVADAADSADGRRPADQAAQPRPPA